MDFIVGLVEETIIKCAAEQLQVAMSNVSLDLSLEGHRGDSLDRVEFVLKLEEIFNIDVPDVEEGKLKNQPLGVYCSLVHMKLAERAKTPIPTEHLDNLRRCKFVQ
jgi:acyl carrier protein